MMSASVSSSKISSRRLCVIGSSEETNRIASIRGLISSAVMSHRILSHRILSHRVVQIIRLGSRLGHRLALAGLDAAEGAGLHDPDLQLLDQLEDREKRDHELAPRPRRHEQL